MSRQSEPEKDPFTEVSSKPAPPEVKPTDASPELYDELVLQKEEVEHVFEEGRLFSPDKYLLTQIARHKLFLYEDEEDPGVSHVRVELWTWNVHGNPTAKPRGMVKIYVDVLGKGESPYNHICFMERTALFRGQDKSFTQDSRGPHLRAFAVFRGRCQSPCRRWKLEQVD